MRVILSCVSIFLGFSVLLSVCTLVRATTNVPLPSYPLAVKSPYLSAWLPGNQTSDVATAQPQFWAGQNLTWAILARIDSITYSLFGLPHAPAGTVAAKTLGISYTSTHTVISLLAGTTFITLDFFSPVFPEPADYARQSLPYSYLTVSAKSTTSRTHRVQILSAIDQTWTAQKGASDLSYAATRSVGYFTFYNPAAIHFTEEDDMATYGSVIYATLTKGANMSHACRPAAEMYATFAQTGSIKNNGICTATDLAGLSQALGLVGKKATNVTFAIGFDRANAVNFLGSPQTALYRSKWPTVPTALDYVFTDYSDASSASWEFDHEIRSRSEAVSKSFGKQYADIVEASVRQCFGAMELTVPANNMKQAPQAFIKEISSDGNVNTIDIIFQTWPIFIVLNPEYIRMLLQPTLTYLSLPKSQGWPQPWVIHDLGRSYPNATGHHDGNAEQMPLFETSALFIMLYAYQKYSGNTAWAQQYQPLLKGYADYLVTNSLSHRSQLFTVDAIPPTANQTALTIQSAIALQAASKLFTTDTVYAAKAQSFVQSIYYNALGLNGATLAQSSHFTYNYGKNNTWNVVFAAYSDVLLDLRTFPSAAWDMQSKWYLSQMQGLGLPFSNPITSANYTGTPVSWALSDWNIVASGASSAAVQAAVIDTTHKFLTNGMNGIPFGTKYYTNGSNAGMWIANRARSTVGSNFALLALNQQV